jgi:TolA-binding protein
VTVEITDYDQDQSNERDTVRFQVIVNDGDPVMLTATETEEYSGIFTKEVDTSATAETDKLTVKKGDRIYVRYIDTQNTFPGHAVPRESVVYVNEPSEGRVRILESRITPPPADSKAKPTITYLPPSVEQKTSGVAFEAPLTVEVIDPDAAKDSRSTVTVSLATTDGATVDVVCEISPTFSDAPPGQPQWALEEGRFVGQAIMQLGGKASPAMVPLTADMPRSLIGRVKLGDDEDSELADSNLVTHVLNLTGKDVITASYNDELRPAGQAQLLTADGRLLSNGQLAVTDRDYEKETVQLHVGEKLFLMVTDPDQDSSTERDMVEVEVTSEFGEKEVVQLAETLAHSGLFTGSFLLKAVEKPEPGNLEADDPAIESYFGDTLRVRYVDKAASTEDGTLELLRETPVVVGTNGLVAAFTKTFNDETLAVETKFRIAESYFELFKSHKELARGDEQKTDLEAGRRVLQEVMEDYPDRKYAPRIAYLLGQFAQELEQWDEAIRSYELILRQFPDHTLAADAQYKLAQALEEAGEFDKALEEYVTLAATYPKSPLISSVMIRISDYFYKAEIYEISAQVGEKFLERFEGHEHASRMAFRVGQCYYKAKQYTQAGAAFDDFGKTFPEDDLSGDAMFWAGESYRLANNNLEAFRRYNRCRWDHPASEAAKYARGRLALPEMLQQFEADIASVDDDN